VVAGKRDRSGTRAGEGCVRPWSAISGRVSARARRPASSGAPIGESVDEQGSQPDPDDAGRQSDGEAERGDRAKEGSGDDPTPEKSRRQPPIRHGMAEASGANEPCGPAKLLVAKNPVVYDAAGSERTHVSHHAPRGIGSAVERFIRKL
jgi:hypothetical protein